MYVCSYGHRSWLELTRAGGVQWRNRACCPRPWVPEQVGEAAPCLLAGKISWRTYFRLSANRHFTFRGHGGIPRAASVAEALVWTPQLAAAPNDYLLTRMMRLVLALLGFLLPTALPVPAAPISGGIGLSVKSFVRCGTPCPLNFSP